MREQEVHMGREKAVIVLLVLVLTLIRGELVADNRANALDPAAGPSRVDIEQIVHEYLLAHPEVIMESVRTFQERQRAEERERAMAALVTKQAELFHDAASPATGSALDAVRVVEFFDYRCPYCKRVDPTVMKPIAEQPNVLVIFKEFPILGPESTLAAKAALAAHDQGAYLNFHEALMTSNEPISEVSLQQLAT